MNPWLFYAMNVCHGAKAFALLISFACGAILFLLAASHVFNTIDGFKPDHRLRDMAKRIMACFVICILIYMLIPSKDTLLMMQAARMATTDNVNMVFEALKNATDYAVSVMK